MTDGKTITREPARCGTPSGATRHSRLGEKPCDACAKAKAEYDARYRKSEEKRRADRLRAQAQGRAYRDLSWRHPEEYAELYDQHKRELGVS